MPTGTVKWFNSQKGYGFIQPKGGGQDVFVHISAVERAGLRSLNEGQAIEFELVSNRGRTAAENLRFVDQARRSASPSRISTGSVRPSAVRPSPLWTARIHW